MRSRISSKLMFASCVGHFDRAYYGFYVTSFQAKMVYFLDIYTSYRIIKYAGSIYLHAESVDSYWQCCRFTTASAYQLCQCPALCLMPCYEGFSLCGFFLRCAAVRCGFCAPYDFAFQNRIEPYDFAIYSKPHRTVG